MTAIRAIWCIHSPKGEQREILFSRRFTTVERREQRFAAQAEAARVSSSSKPSDSETTSEPTYKYSSIPKTDQFLLDPVLFPIPQYSPVGQIPPLLEFPQLRECSSEEVLLYQESFYSSDRAKAVGLTSSLFPVVHFSKRELYWVAIPALLEETPTTTSEMPKVIDLLCVTATLSLLNEMQSIYELVNSKNLPAKTPAIWDEISIMVSWMMPFGSPIESQADRARTTFLQGFPPKLPAHGSKKPSWKPYNFSKGKPSIEYIIEEKIDSAQCDNPQSPDVLMITGNISCTASLPGNPEISLSLTTNPQNKVKISDVSYSPYVQSAESEGSHKKVLTFSPPLERFSLCDYQVIGVEKAPVRGFYQMKQVNMIQAKILVQLKLFEGVNNQFEKFVITIPFYNRGKIVNAEMSQNQGTLTATKNSLIWNLGQKITTRGNEVLLRAMVTFDTNDEQNINNSTKFNELFCVDQNSYIDVQFEAEEFLISNLQLDNRIPSAQNLKLPTLLRRITKSSNYKIWNSLGCSSKAITVVPQSSNNVSQ